MGEVAPWSRLWRWNMFKIFWEIVKWPKEVTLVTRTQPSGPLCLWQCLNIMLGHQKHKNQLLTCLPPCSKGREGAQLWQTAASDSPNYGRKKSFGGRVSSGAGIFDVNFNININFNIRSYFPTGHCWATPTGPRPGGSSSFIEEWRKWTELASHEIFQADEELQSAEENKHSWCLSIGQAPWMSMNVEGTTRPSTLPSQKPWFKQRKLCTLIFTTSESVSYLKVNIFLGRTWMSPIRLQR